MDTINKFLIKYQMEYKDSQVGNCDYKNSLHYKTFDKLFESFYITYA